jgi:hypothetical protein
MAGRGGAGGGAAGAGGTSGGAGRGGATGTAGRGGATGTAGRGGGGGAAAAGGRGGTTGTGGAGGNTCPLGGRLDCTAAGVLELPTGGQVVDFSAGQLSSMNTRWCNTSGLDGSLFAFEGPGSMASASVDLTARSLALDLMVVPGEWAGGGVYFDSCVDARNFNSIQFTASVASGSLTNCVWQVQVQTQDERPTTLTNPTGGTCNATMRTCSRYPAATLANATTMATTYTVRFNMFNNPAGSTIPMASQVVGLQWQVNSGNSGSGACSVELRIDNVRFVTQ